MRTSFRCVSLLVLLSWCVVFAGCKHREAGECSPFGDKPATLYGAPIPECTEGARLGPWNDRDGTQRYACLYEPPVTASTARPLPLIVFIHPSLFPADMLQRWTDLLDHLASADLSGDPARRGFILLAPEGRDTLI